MPKRSRSRNPKKPPLKERFLAPFILEYARRQVRRGERAGTRQRRPQALLSAPPATGSSTTASVPPTQSFPSPYLLGDLIANTALEPGHAQLGTTLYNNQTTPPHTIQQSGLEYPDFPNASHRQSTAAKTSFGSTSGSDSHGTSNTSTARSTGLGESSLDNEGLLSELSPLASWTQLGLVSLIYPLPWGFIVLTLPKYSNRPIYSGRSESRIVPRLLALVQAV